MRTQKKCFPHIFIDGVDPTMKKKKKKMMMIIIIIIDYYYIYM